SGQALSETKDRLSQRLRLHRRFFLAAFTRNDRLAIGSKCVRITRLVKEHLMAGLNQRLSIGIGILLAVIGASGARAQVKTDGPRSLDEKPLLLRDFKPTSMLHAPVHNVYRARFPVIDVHNHVNDARSAGREHTPPARVVEVMDRCNIQTIVILTGEWGDRLQRVLDE